MDEIESNSYEACLQYCESYPECKWFSYNKNFQLCLLFENCQELDEDLADFVSGQVNCQPPLDISKILIAGGSSSTVEVYDMETGHTCSSLPNFPNKYGGFGNFITDTIFMMCGGYDNYYCYYMDTSDPNPAFIQGPELNRSYSHAIRLKNSSLWIIGSGKKETEIVSLTEAINGPALPKEFRGPCILQFDESTMAIFDGEDFLLYNFESKKWSEGPSKPTKSYSSGCAMFQYSASHQYILVGGGYELTSKNPTNKVEIFDVRYNRWYNGEIEISR